MLVLALWGGALLLQAALADASTEPSRLCLFRRVTDLPCATCGGTRATLALLTGRILEAVRLNPLVMLGWIAVPSGGAWLMLRRRRGAPPLAPSLERRLWIAAGILLALNWAYLLIARPN